MSRVGKKAIAVPSGVTVKVAGRDITAQGPKGSSAMKIPAGTQIVAAGHARMVAYDLHSGDEAWSLVGIPSACCSSPVTDGNVLYFAGGSGGEGDEEFQMPPFDSMLKDLDADKDGSLSRAEAEKAFEGFFDNQDANKDGKVTVDEAPEQFRPHIEALIKRADEDDDDAVTLEEFRAAGPPDRKPPGAPGKGDDQKPAKPAKDAEKPAGEAGKGPRRPDGLFRVLDADGDGQLSSAELDDAASALRKLDADGDGKIGSAEVVKLQPERKKGNE